MAKTTTGKITDLRQDDRNANSHKERGKELLQKSLHELGAGRSVLADANGVLIAGNNTVETAIAEGITKTIVVETTGNELVVVKRTDLDLNDPGESGRRARQMALVDNAAALEGIAWDVEAVQEIEEQWGFEASEWGVELPEEEKEIPAAEEDEGAGALPSHPVTVKGDVWELISEGKKLRHRIMCGDSTDSDAVAKVIGGETISLIVTDPPYGIDASNQTLGTGKKDFHRGNDWDKERPTIDYILTYCDKAIIWGGNYFTDQLPPSNDWLCWHKKNDGLSFSEFELAYTTLGKNCRHIQHHWSGEKKLHPTQKPLPVIAWCVEFGNVGDLVFDFYLGSGTTLIACEQLHRNCYGVELDEKYCDVIVRRWIAQMEKDGANWKVLLNGEERADMVSKLLEQNK